MSKPSTRVSYISLDVSTSCTGVALFDKKGELVEAFSYSPKVSKKIPNSDHYLMKAAGFTACLVPHVEFENIEGVWIEEPLARSKGSQSLVVTNRFNALLSYICWQRFGVFPEHLSVYAWRRQLCPEFVKIKTLKTGKVSSSTWQMPEGMDPKAYIHAKALAWFPTVMGAATLTKSDGTLHSESYDISDAVGVGVARLMQLGILTWEELERRSKLARRIKRT